MIGFATRGLLAVVALLAITVATATANPLPMPEPESNVLLPRDDAAIDPSFRIFREKLIEAVERRDSQFLLAVVASDIRISFGDTNGKEAFVSYWKPDEATSKVWDALRTLLALGGKLTTSTQFVAPYIYAVWPEDRDAFEYVAVVVPIAALRVEPNSDSAVVTPLNHAIVEMLDTAGLKSQHECADTDWLKVKTGSGDEGYVMCREVRSPVDYRAYFEKQGDKWMMTTFIAGD
jgi:hypothetical protein